MPKSDPRRQRQDRLDQIRVRDANWESLARIGIYLLTLTYLFGVCINSVSLVVLVWLRVRRSVDIPYSTLTGMSAGSAGLGAGSLAFRYPLKYLFRYRVR